MAPIRRPFQWSEALRSYLRDSGVNVKTFAKQIHTYWRAVYFWIEPWPAGVPRRCPSQQSLRDVERVTKGRVPAMLFHRDVRPLWESTPVPKRRKKGTREHAKNP